MRRIPNKKSDLQKKKMEVIYFLGRGGGILTPVQWNGEKCFVFFTIVATLKDKVPLLMFQDKAL